MSYIKLDDSGAFIESKIPDIIHAYINSRMECVVGARNGIIEDPLEDEGRVLEQLELFNQLCRFKYETTRDILIRHSEPLIQQLAVASTQAVGAL